VNQEPFKGFIVLSCHPGVAEAMGYKFNPEKLAEYPWYAVSNGRDRLYPLDQVKPYYKRLKKAGARIVARIYPDLDHGLGFGDREKPEIVKWILNKKP
jgi:predicted esterase